MKEVTNKSFRPVYDWTVERSVISEKWFGHTLSSFPNCFLGKMSFYWMFCSDIVVKVEEEKHESHPGSHPSSLTLTWLVHIWLNNPVLWWQECFVLWICSTSTFSSLRFQPFSFHLNQYFHNAIIRVGVENATLHILQQQNPNRLL